MIPPDNHPLPEDTVLHSKATRPDFCVSLQPLPAVRG